MPVKGIPEAMQDTTVIRAWVLYSVHKRTLRQCAAALLKETQYASAESFMQALYRQFKHYDLPLRSPGPRKGYAQRKKRTKGAA